MKIHILGICGTFMGGVALLARQAGHAVEGSDAGVYPPMSTQLEEQGIALCEGYRAEHLGETVEQVVVGNALSRGNPAVEHLLDRGLRYTSGPQWLAENVLQGRWVLAVAGTHGKTTTASMIAWILEYAGLTPGFLIGGVPANFGVSARLGNDPFFVVEADEYDSAFFDKRSKFVHYRPRTAVLNNLEFDHADIFDDLAAIRRQFHHLVRTIPGSGLIVANRDEAEIERVLEMGCWTPVEGFGTNGEWRARPEAEDFSAFEVWLAGRHVGTVRWGLSGRHNMYNALAAIAAARHAGVPVQHCIDGLAEFKGVKRRQEVRGVVDGITVYDDFAHHPTAIHLTLEGLRRKVGEARILAILEPRSNTMKLGHHKAELAASLTAADRVLILDPPELPWSLTEALAPLGAKAEVLDSVAAIVERVRREARPGDHLLVMSNGGFGGIHQKLLDALADRS
ncbi:UDP-N-acetylmuramate:L-alanyl-gamma-D-glutamyl-meso-diaminopimelate ligase [Endothiovibrio diazotrophicus]